MPTYEYRCPVGHEFEKFFRTISSAQSELPCPKCGALAERHMSAGAGLVFKGSGFYLTDYGKNAHATRGDTKPSPGSDSARDGGSSEGGTEKKPAEPKASASPVPAPSESAGGTADAKKKSASGGDSKPAATKRDTKSES